MSRTLTSSMWRLMGAGCPGSPAVLLVVGRGIWVQGWPHCGSSAAGQGDWTMARWSLVGLVLGSTVDTWSASAPGCLCRIVLPSYAKGNSDPEVVSVLLSGVLVCGSR